MTAYLGETLEDVVVESHGHQVVLQVFQGAPLALDLGEARELLRQLGHATQHAAEAELVRHATDVRMPDPAHPGAWLVECACGYSCHVATLNPAFAEANAQRHLLDVYAWVTRGDDLNYPPHK